MQQKPPPQPTPSPTNPLPAPPTPLSSLSFPCRLAPSPSDKVCHIFTFKTIFFFFTLCCSNWISDLTIYHQVSQPVTRTPVTCPTYRFVLICEVHHPPLLDGLGPRPLGVLDGLDHSHQGDVAALCGTDSTSATTQLDHRLVSLLY